MRVLILVLSLLYGGSLFGQIPTGYYEGTDGAFGESLKIALNQIIKDHKEYPYTSSSTDTWDILKRADQDPHNPDHVLLIYTGESVDADQEYNSGKGWNREHVWAKSRGDFGTALGAGTDCHALKAANISLNSTRNNRFFANGNHVIIYRDTPSGNYLGENSYVFEPRDAVKGDVARMIFYMATRYEGENGEPDLELTEDILDKADKSPLLGNVSALLEWHHQDPVDDFEKNRNEVIFEYQGNRNPFIDHPEFATMIWGNPTSTHAVENKTLKFTQSGSNFTLRATYIMNTVEVSDLCGKILLSEKVGSKQQYSFSFNKQGIFILLVNNEYPLKFLSH